MLTFFLLNRLDGFQQSDCEYAFILGISGITLFPENISELWLWTYVLNQEVTFVLLLLHYLVEQERGKKFSSVWVCSLY